MTDEQHDPIDNMPSQLQAANRRKRAAKNGMGNPPSQPVPMSVEERLDALERENAELRARAGASFVDMQPDAQPDPRLGALEQMSDFTRRLLGQTHDVPSDFVGDVEPPYNVPNRTYLKPDGTYVSLQGDARSRARYTEKGYRCLSLDETRHYLEVERPRLVREQRHKAALIGGIRKLVEREPDLAGYRADGDWDNGLNLMNIAGLQAEWRTLCAQTRNPDRKEPSVPRFRSDEVAERDPMMAGVETQPPSRRVAEFEALQEHIRQTRVRGGRTIEVTPQNANQFR